MNKTLQCMMGVVAATVAWLGGPAWAGDAEMAQSILEAKCGKCHDKLADGKLVRISEIRATPEGWALTLRRMREWHHIELSAEDGAVLVKYLADSQGLAPEETTPFRAVMERRPGTMEGGQDPELTAYCGRCHTYARFGLQRRDTADWLKLVHTHVGQFPTLEYQDGSRGREWWKDATTTIVEKLGKVQPFTTAAWTAWQSHKTADLTGHWRVVGHRPGRGDYAGTLTVTGTGADRYDVSSHLVYADGAAVDGKGKSIVYTGYEWRGSVALGKEEVKEIFQVAADGNSLSGRWFLDDDDAIGGDLTAARDGAPGVPPVVMAVQPASLKAGQTAKLTIIGSGLKGGVDLGPGVTVTKVISASADAVTVLATAAKDAADGARPVTVGEAKLADGLAVFHKIDKLVVEPAYTIARTGGDGGPIAKLPAQFEAVAYAGGLRLGVVAAKWSTAPFDAIAAASKDQAFAGGIGKGGLFQPAVAGPIKARRGANNAGNLTVKATVGEGADRLEGTAHLIVTVQRWNDASIR